MTTAVAIAMASAGFGAWSLAWSRVAGSVVLFALTFALAPERYRPAWDAALARRLLRFGLPLAGASIVVFAVMNVDYAVIGNILGPDAARRLRPRLQPVGLAGGGASRPPCGR